MTELFEEELLRQQFVEKARMCQNVNEMVDFCESFLLKKKPGTPGYIEFLQKSLEESSNTVDQLSNKIETIKKSFPQISKLSYSTKITNEAIEEFKYTSYDYSKEIEKDAIYAIAKQIIRDNLYTKSIEYKFENNSTFLYYSIEVVKPNKGTE